MAEAERTTPVQTSESTGRNVFRLIDAHRFHNKKMVPLQSVWVDLWIKNDSCQHG
jgi:hypothetical protein